MKQSFLTAYVCLCILAVEVSADDNSAALPDLALQPPRVLTDFGPDHVKSSRGAQGIPAIERSAQGRLSGHGRYVGSTGEMKIQRITAVAALWSCREKRPDRPDPFGPLQSDSCLQRPDSLLAANVVRLQSVCIVHTMWHRPTL